jgi:hypothetical protein
MITSATTVILAERAGLQYDKERYSKALYEREEIQKMKEERASRAEEMGMMTKTTRWISANKYSVIMGSWATSMVGAWAVVNRDKCVRFYILYRGVSSSFDRYMTFSQKIVQVRMWAQGYAFEQMHDTVILKHFEIA